MTISSNYVGIFRCKFTANWIHKITIKMLKLRNLKMEIWWKFRRKKDFLNVKDFLKVKKLKNKSFHNCAVGKNFQSLNFPSLIVNVEHKHLHLQQGFFHGHFSSHLMLLSWKLMTLTDSKLQHFMSVDVEKYTVKFASFSYENIHANQFFHLNDLFPLNLHLNYCVEILNFFHSMRAKQFVIKDQCFRSIHQILSFFSHAIPLIFVRNFKRKIKWVPRVHQT